MSMLASYTEIYVSFLVLIGIILLSIGTLRDMYHIVFDALHGSDTMEISAFLSTAFELIIGIEFVKMLAKHTPSSAVEVLLYAIARQLISSTEGHMIEALLGVIAIGILFAIRKYLSETIHHSNKDDFIVNGSITIDDLNAKIGSNIDPVLGNTIAGLIFNHAKNANHKLTPGYEYKVDGYLFQVYSMDAGLIKQIRISTETIS
jgi:hypothetical protein